MEMAMYLKATLSCTDISTVIHHPKCQFKESSLVQNSSALVSLHHTQLFSKLAGKHK